MKRSKILKRIGADGKIYVTLMPEGVSTYGVDEEDVKVAIADARVILRIAKLRGYY